MKMRILGFLILTQFPMLLQAMDLALAEPEKKPLTKESFFNALKDQEVREEVRAYFDPTTNREQAQKIVEWLQRTLGTETAPDKIRLFEISQRLTEDPTISSEEFRTFMSMLRSPAVAADQKPAGILVFPITESPAENPGLPSSFYKPQGLPNFGVSCYANMSLQLMFLLTKGMFQEAGPDDTNESRKLLVNLISNVQSNMIAEQTATTPLTQEQKKAVNQSLQAFYNHERTLCFSAKEESISASQQDAQQFMNALLTQFAPHKYFEQKKVPDAENQENDAKPADEAELVEDELATGFAQRFALTLTTYLETPEAEIKPTECTFPCLTLSIHKGGSLTKVLTDFFKPEQVEDYKIEKQGPEGIEKKAVTVTKRSTITKCGNCIVLNLNRAALNNERITTPTPFQLVGLNLKRFLDQQDELETADFELVGVGMHGGRSARGGHYVAFIRAELDNRKPWIYCDDDSREIISDKVMTQIAGAGHGYEYSGGYFLPTIFVYQRSERKDIIPSKTLRFCLAVRQGDGIVVEHLPLSNDHLSAQDKEVEEYIKEGDTPPKNSPFAIFQSSSPASSSSNSSTSPKYIWSDPKNIIIPIILILVAAIYGKEETPTEKAEKEKEKEEKKKKDQKMREPQPTPAVALGPSKKPQS